MKEIDEVIEHLEQAKAILQDLCNKRTLIRGRNIKKMTRVYILAETEICDVAEKLEES